MIEIYKDADVDETITRIRKWFQSAGIEIEVKSKQNVSGFHSHLLSINNTFLFTNGKGLTEKQSLASAYGEMSERCLSNVLFRYHAKHDYQRLNKYLDIEKIHSKDLDTTRVLDHGLNYELIMILQKYMFQNTDDSSIACLPFTNYKDGEISFIPISIIDAFYNTNGLAYGNSQQEAAVQAISEIFERYVNKRILVEDLDLPSPKNWEYFVTDEFQKKISDLCNAYHLNIKILEAASDFSLPVVAVIVFNQDGDYFVKFGAHFNFQIALSRCLTELFQGRSMDEDFWKKRNLKDNNFTRNLEKVIKDGDGYYTDKFLTSKRSSKMSFDFGKTNEEALENYLKIIHNKGYNVYFYEYYNFKQYVEHYLIPGMSDVVEDKDQLIKRYAWINRHHYLLENFLDNNAIAEEYYDFIIESSLDNQELVFDYTKYPLKNRNNFSYFTFEYVKNLIQVILNRTSNIKFSDDRIQKRWLMLKNNINLIEDQSKISFIANFLKLPTISNGEIYLDEFKLTLTQEINEIAEKVHLKKSSAHQESLD